MTYTLKGTRTVRPSDYEERMKRDGHCSMLQEPHEVTFRTGMEMLRWCMNNGAFSRSLWGNGRPTTVDRVSIGSDDSRVQYGYIDSFFRYKVTPADMSAMRRARDRWMEIVHYLREVEPEWVEGKEFHYMDNSVERHDTNKYGQTRRVMLKPPSGDACF